MNIFLSYTQIRSRVLTASCCALLALPGLSMAAATDIKDIPMAIANNAPPNIMLMIDDSGSMDNIVAEAFTNNLASCDSGNTVAGGVAAPTIPTANSQWRFRIRNGVPKIRISGTDYDWGNTTGKRCFNPTLQYKVKIYADSGSDLCTGATTCYEPDNPDIGEAVYSGAYLNWYMGYDVPVGTMLTGWTNRRPGTKDRMEVARQAGKDIVNALELDKQNVGLSGYLGGTGGRLLAEIKNLNSSHRTSILTKIDTMIADGNTPLAETLAEIGRYFASGAVGDLTLHPAADVPTKKTATVDSFFNSQSLENETGNNSLANPTQYWCQKNFAVLLTDGLPTVDDNLSADMLDYLGHCAAGQCIETTGNGGKKPGVYYEDNGSDYLDDVAGALYDVDLRPDLKRSDGEKPTKNNVISYFIGFSDLQVKDSPLMHSAAEAGGGEFIFADNPTALTDAFKKVIADIGSRNAAAAAVSVSNPVLTSGDNTIYSSSYISGIWTGDLYAYPYNSVARKVDVDNPVWNTGCVNPNIPVDQDNPSRGIKGCSAGIQLDALASPSTTRKIFTYTGLASGTPGVQFLPFNATPPSGTTLSSTQQTLLNTPTLTDGATVVNYLRGDRTGQSDADGNPVASYAYRWRSSILGDIINAKSLVVIPPGEIYADSGYATFKTNNAGRTKIVIQPANDGMVHAFNAATGAEEWAYVPNLLMADLNQLSRKTNFTHKYFVDGSPVYSDVDFGNTHLAAVTTPDWKTIVAGGLGKGGRGYYALNVTATTAADETAAAGFALWEFPNSATTASVKSNIGYSFGRPIIAKTRAAGWVALVTSGYNNGSTTGGDGQGYLFVLNAKTGALIRAISTGVGSSSDPSGLAHISAYADSASTDRTAKFVYGGDLKGNVWRFDLSGLTTASWNVARLAVLTTAGGAFQPVTAEPELAQIKISGVYKHFVYVGTGLYLGDTDIPGAVGANTHATQTQTMYGLIDNLSATPLINPPGPPVGNVRDNLTQQTFSNVAGNAAGTLPNRNASQNALDASAKGWYIDMTNAGERINTSPALAEGILTFASNIPSSTVCEPGGRSLLNRLNYQTGGYTAAASGDSSEYLGEGLASDSQLVKDADGNTRTLTQKTDGTIADESAGSTGTGSTPVNRRAWREILQ